MTDRDPEAEAEEKVEEEKLIEAEPEPVAADTWGAAATGFETGGVATTEEWGAAPAEPAADWGAAAPGAPGTTEWGADTTAQSGAQW